MGPDTAFFATDSQKSRTSKYLKIAGFEQNWAWFEGKKRYFEVFAGSGLLLICSKACNLWTQDFAQLEFNVIPREVLGIIVTRQQENFLKVAEI